MRISSHNRAKENLYCRKHRGFTIGALYFRSRSGSSAANLNPSGSAVDVEVRRFIGAIPS
jgi:hypothetical protein